MCTKGKMNPHLSATPTRFLLTWSPSNFILVIFQNNETVTVIGSSGPTRV